MLTTHFINSHHIKKITVQDNNYCIEFSNNTFIVLTPEALAYINQTVEEKLNDNDNRK